MNVNSSSVHGLVLIRSPFNNKDIKEISFLSITAYFLTLNGPCEHAYKMVCI